jgi:hypothetical protein
MFVVPMNSDQKAQMRRRSMQGTALFALAIIAAIAFVATGSVWLVGVAVVLLIPSPHFSQGIGEKPFSMA